MSTAVITAPGVAECHGQRMRRDPLSRTHTCRACDTRIAHREVVCALSYGRSLNPHVGAARADLSALAMLLREAGADDRQTDAIVDATASLDSYRWPGER